MRVNSMVALVLAALSLSACMHARTHQDDQDPNVVSAQDADQIKREGSTTKNDLNDSNIDLDAIPADVNRQVLQWVDYFQGRGREHMERYLSRSTRYIPMMKAILHKQGLPEDLVYIALIESGFSPAATSQASAVGYWQFIRPTGRTYGLQIDQFVDERRDYIRSTEAAADYFKALYNLFGSWYLSIASYNVGENRIKNVVMRQHTRDFWEMARNKKLPKETSEYIPKFLAARMIAKEPEKYGFTDIDYQAPIDFVEVTVAQTTDLKNMAKEMGIDYVDLTDLNPMFKRGIAVDKNGKVVIRVPRGTEDKATVAAANSVVTDRKIYAVRDDDDVTSYRVHRGETLAKIARKFHVSTRRLRSINGFTSRTRLVAGKKIKVPNDSTAGMAGLKSYASNTGKSESANSDSSEAAPKVGRRHHRSRDVAAATDSNSDSASKVHVVRRGDNLATIARKYNVSISRLAAANQISRRSKILVGSRLEIPD